MNSKDRFAWRWRLNETLLVFLALGLAGCAAVEPWQKAKLAQAGMALDFDTLGSRLHQQVYLSKEAARGGDAAGGGGCGCN